MKIREIAGLAPVIPVVKLGDPAQAVPLAQVLVSAGLRVIQIDMGTAAAIGGIEAIRKAVPAAIVGAGALTRAAEFAAAGRVGVQFGSSPGFTSELAAAARGARFPLLPGVMTPSEVMTARHAGFDSLSFHPAQQPGGAILLGALAAAFPDICFCAAGGVTQGLAAEYLALPNVICVLGSWMLPEALVQAGDWHAIEAMAREAATLSRHRPDPVS